MLHYKQSGSGYPVVLIHGFCENNTCFNKQVLLLNELGIQTITPDLPGFGGSASSVVSTMEAMADELAKLLTDIRAQKYVLVGHSMGGYVSLALAKKHPDLIAGIGLLHSTAAADTEVRKQKRDQSIRFISQHGVDAFVSNFIPPLFAPNFPEKNLVAEAVNEAKRTTVEGLCGALIGMKNRPDSTSFISQLQTPVMYIAGQHDTLIPLKAVYEQSALLKNGTIHILRDSAHMGMIEEPEKCAAHIASFVRDCY